MSDLGSGEPTELSPQELWRKQVEAFNNAGFEMGELARRALALAEAAVAAIENGEIGVADAAIMETQDIVREQREVFYKYGGPFGVTRPRDES